MAGRATMGRHYSYILDPSISLVSHLMARVEQKERRSQLFAGSQLLLWWRPVYKSASCEVCRQRSQHETVSPKTLDKPRFIRLS